MSAWPDKVYGLGISSLLALAATLEDDASVAILGLRFHGSGIIGAQVRHHG